jgi:hypothetical protein
LARSSACEPQRLGHRKQLNSSSRTCTIPFCAAGTVRNPSATASALCGPLPDIPHRAARTNFLHSMASSEPRAPRPAYMEEEDEDGNKVRGSRRSARKKEERERSKPKVSHRPSSDKKQVRSDSGVDAAGYGAAMMSGARQDDEAMAPEVRIERRRSSAGTASRPKKYESQSSSSSAKSKGAGKTDQAKYYGIPAASQAIATPIAAPLPYRARPSIITAQSYPARPLSFHAGSGPPISNQYFWQSQPPNHYPPPAPSANYMQGTAPPPEYPSSASPITPRSLSSRFGPPRTGSGYGFRDPIIQQRRPDDLDDGYMSATEGRPRASIRTPSNRLAMRTREELDYAAMPPPPRPTSARPGPSILRRTDYPLDVAPAPEPEFRERERESRTYHRDDRAPRRQSINRLPRINDFGAGRVEAANSGRRRQSYYGQTASTGSGASGESALEEKIAQATSYQDGVSGSAAPLTADMLRHKERRERGSIGSTKSSSSRDESDYRRSATTRTTRSVSSPEDENVTIKVTGQARVVVGGAQIDCNDGGEIEIKRQKSVKGSESVRGGSEWSNSEYGGDRRSRTEKSAGQSRRRSVSYARPSPQYPMGQNFI